MEKSLREVLLQDLCARLPYGVMVNAQYKDGDGWKIEDRKLLGIYADGQVYVDAVYTNVENIKPYLRQMSSMTEEERKEYELLANHCIVTSIGFIHFEAAPLIDWLNAHHFDYRGLIEKGLALEAPEDMYK